MQVDGTGATDWQLRLEGPEASTPQGTQDKSTFPTHPARGPKTEGLAGLSSSVPHPFLKQGPLFPLLIQKKLSPGQAAAPSPQ